MSGTQGGGPDGPDPGLCARCRHAHVQRSARGSRFWRCGLADRDARFRRYPPLPVRACPGYAPERGDGPEGEARPPRGGRSASLARVARSPDVGDPAPDFTLPSTEGEIRLSDRLREGAVLLVFYPGDDTPVCTRQLCDYRDHAEDFARLGVQVLALNPQPLHSHESFRKRHDLPFPLLCDERKEVCRSYGALGLLGSAKRALVLVGRDGRVLYRRVDLPVFRRSAEELEAVIAELDLGAGEARGGS